MYSNDSGNVAVGMLSHTLFAFHGLNELTKYTEQDIAQQFLQLLKY